ncbi:MAG: hypothetical protein AAB354_00160 [candidate division KSB1 bacterium]
MKRAFTLLTVLLPAKLFAMQTVPDTSASLQKDALNIYLDCDSFCDFDFIRTEIPYVNYVRDRKEAQLHVLITTQRTGSGGREHTLSLIGQHNFAGLNDTLKYVSQQTDTDDAVRKGLVRALKIGLVRYVSKTPFIEHLALTYNKPASASKVADKWNYWVFRFSANGYFNGEKSAKFTSLYGTFSARRVTSALKINFQLYGNYNESSFDFGERTISSFSRSKGTSLLAVKSLGEHWSLGSRGNAYSSTYSNIKFAGSVSPAVEYNFFPYSQSTRRQLRFLYEVGWNRRSYAEVTIYAKNKETLFDESLTFALESKQPWGSIETELEGSHYLHDFSKNRLELNSQLSLQLFKGVSLELYGSFSLIHDQLSLPKGGATEEEILLQRKQLETQYQYFGSLGISYTFGSIYNNVVNPRFGN